MSTLTPEQHEQLLRPIHPSRVQKLDNMSHLEAWDVRAHLIRIFGFGGFSVELLDYECAYESETTTRAGKSAYKVGYRARVRLTIHALNATYVEAAFGESVMPDFKRGDAHDMAIKTAESQALKRAAINLGTQFGLSLYNNGSLADVVKAVLVGPAADPDGVVEAAQAVVAPEVAETHAPDEAPAVEDFRAALEETDTVDAARALFVRAKAAGADEQTLQAIIDKGRSLGEAAAKAKPKAADPSTLDVTDNFAIFVGE